jgi:hypothetical protein
LKFSSQNGKKNKRVDSGSYQHMLNHWSSGERWTESQLSMLYSQSQTQVLCGSLHLEHFTKRTTARKLNKTIGFDLHNGFLTSRILYFLKFRRSQINTHTHTLMSQKWVNEKGNPLHSVKPREGIFYSTKWLKEVRAHLAITRVTNACTRINISQNSRNPSSYILSEAKVQNKTRFTLSFQQNASSEDLLNKQKMSSNGSWMLKNGNGWRHFYPLAEAGAWLTLSLGQIRWCFLWGACCYAPYCCHLNNLQSRTFPGGCYWGFKRGCRLRVVPSHRLACLSKIISLPNASFPKTLISIYKHAAQFLRTKYSQYYKNILMKIEHSSNKK